MASDQELDRFRRGHLGRLLYEMHRDFSLRVKEELERRDHPGVTPALTRVFATLPMEGARLTTMAERAGITKQSMGALVKELEALGYVERARDPDDGRAWRIRFSDAGRALLVDAIAATDAVEASYAEALGERKMATVKKALAELVDALGIDVPA